MKTWGRALLILCAFLCQTVWAQQQSSPNGTKNISAQTLQQDFFADFNLPVAAGDAEKLLGFHPGDITGLFVRMETAALQQRTDAVLDSALRLCTMPAPLEIQEIASSRILEHAANTRAFNDVVRRVGLAMDRGNACTFNLRLALVAAAADGAPHLDLDKTAQSAGLLTQWTIAGPFGHFSNVDFERPWPAEDDRFSNKADAGVERFLFRDGMVSLPDYLSGPGVFYATSQVRTAEQLSRLDVLSPGPYTIFVDGRRVPEKDSRMTAGPNRESVQLRLRPGKHRILVKFTADAAPFSLDLHPEFAGNAQQVKINASQEMQEYIRTLAQYFRGDLNRVAQAAGAHAQEQHGMWVYLRALLWSATEEHSARARAAWDALAKAQPSAFLVRIKLAESAALDGMPDVLRSEIRALGQQLPESEAVAQLQLTLARQDRSGTEAALTHVLELHPSCSRLSETLKFYSTSGQQNTARVMEERLHHCAPDSLEYAKALADAGRHDDAAVAIEETLARNPFNRNALRMLVQQLVLADDIDHARARAKQLAAIGHHSRKFTRMAADPALVLDSSSARGTSFISGNDFYSPYRRDGASMVTTSDAGELKGDRVLVLQDGVLHILGDGAASLYTHRVWRLGSKEAINLHGQSSIPRGADLLELRTIKATGQIIEPELPPGIGSISLPALEPGDNIEEEYVTHYVDCSELPARVFEFGSTDAPVLHTRFVVIGPRTSAVTLAELNGAPHPRIELGGNEIARIWEVDNIARLREEPFGRSGDLVPYVAINAQEHSIDRLRDTLIDSTRIGPHVIDAALAQKFDPALTEREKARRLYRFVTSRIESTGPSLQASSAEDALSSGEGSRTAALFALARASGLRAELLMAQPLESSCTQTLDPNCFTEPLVRFFVNGETIDADAEGDELPFGALSSSLNQERALLVPLQTGGTPHLELVELTARAARQKSVGEGDLFLQGDGSLAASVHVRLGAERAREIRRVLHSSSFSDQQRQSFFDQLAAGILPGAINVRGEASNLGDPDQPLELQMTCTVPQFMATVAGVKSIGQLSPVLGLPGALSATANRKSALYLDTPLSESTVFHLHLPARFSTLALPQDFSSYSEFGSYAVNFSWSGGQLSVKREFEIPAQIVEPDAFAAFANFVRGISAAERQQINLVFKEAPETHVSAVARQ